MAILATRLEQAHRVLGSSDKRCGQDTSRGARANDEIVGNASVITSPLKPRMSDRRCQRSNVQSEFITR